MKLVRIYSLWFHLYKFKTRHNYTVLFREAKSSGKKLKKREFWEDGRVGSTKNLLPT